MKGTGLHQEKKRGSDNKTSSFVAAKTNFFPSYSRQDEVD